MEQWYYTEKRDVERAKLVTGHFIQAAGTPFTVFPLSEVGGTTAFKTSHLPDGTPVKCQLAPLETERSSNCLNGHFLEQSSTISSRISLADFVSAISLEREYKRISSGRHLGHYKLLVKTMENQN
jgi:hypothetical protein